MKKKITAAFKKDSGAPVVDHVGIIYWPTISHLGDGIVILND